MIAAHKPAQGGGTALDALIDAAAGILAADSLEDTLARIAHHSQALLPYDDLTVYEVDAEGTGLRPVFALGMWVEQIMAETLSVDQGTTGWVVRNRRTRNVPNTLDEHQHRRPGSRLVAEAFVCVPLIAHDRVVGTLNVYRIGADRPFTDAEVALVERFATMARARLRVGTAARHLRQQVAHDGLTGLLNHRGGQERLRAAIAGADGRPVSVVVIDLDHFKRINDSLGHAEGDRALAAAAKRCARRPREATPSAASAARSSCSILPGVDADGRARPPSAPASRSARCVGGRAAGVLRRRRRHPDDATDAPGLLEPADAALYAAKHTGRGADLPLPRNLALRPSPAEERSEIEALLRARRQRDPARLPARARARHRPRLRLRGARALRGRAPARPRRVVRPGAPRGPRRRARGARAARRARRPRPSRRHVPGRSTSARGRCSPRRSRTRCRRTCRTS